ncbi:MAG TPA: Hsp70 family protein, partial [Oligoflexia bacterium]|nr:Hsp70 family protein [Oligoflexia bacterium]
VTFDIDANGILHVSAKDLGTGKEQSIRITASSGLSEREIQEMVHAAEEHAAEDKARKEVIEARNQLDGLIYSTEGSLKQYGASLDAADRAEIERALESAKKKLDDANSKELLQAEVEALANASHKLAKKMYESASGRQQGAGASAAQGDASSNAAESGSAGDGDNVVDADFEEVK